MLSSLTVVVGGGCSRTTGVAFALVLPPNRRIPTPLARLPLKRQRPGDPFPASSSAIALLRSFTSDASPLLDHRIQAIVDSKLPPAKRLAAPTSASSSTTRKRPSSTSASASASTFTSLSMLQAHQIQLPSSTLSSSSQGTTALTITAVRRMRIHDLRVQLSRRGLKFTGNRPVLITRLLQAVRQENESSDPDHLQSQAFNSDDDESNNSQVDDLEISLSLGGGDDDDADKDCSAILSGKLFEAHPSHAYTLRARGYTSRNSGGVGVGMVVYADGQEDQEPLWTGRMYVAGDRTMFESEYTALWLAIDYATTMLHIRRLKVEIDNEIVVGQIQGMYKTNRESLATLLKFLQIQIEAKQDSKMLDEYHGINRISPVANQLAGKLARKAFAQRKTVIDRLHDWIYKDPLDVVSLAEDRPTQSEGGKWAEPDEESKSNSNLDPDEVFLLQFDGGSRGNPGIAGAGMVIYNEEGEEIWCGWKYHSDRATNNMAEYLGLLYGLQCAQSLGIKKIIVEGDSQLIVKQIHGIYRCKEPKLKQYYSACKKLLSEFEQSKIKHIPRAQNSRADWLANHAMDLRESDGFMPVTPTE